MTTNDERDACRPRQVLHDDRIEQRARYGTPVMLVLLGSLGLAISSGRLSDVASNLALLAVWVVAIVGVGSIVVPLYVWYRCPDCKARLPRLPPRSDADRSVRFECERCNVEWATGFVSGDHRGRSTD